MRTLTSRKTITELGKIAQSGTLTAKLVERAARPKTSPIHHYFCWDNDMAAYEYRLIQAGQLIRACVRMMDVEGEKRAVRVFVSLRSDRGTVDGGYREIVVVLSNKNLRQQLLNDALEDMRAFEARYAHLKELTAIFRASKKVREALKI